MLDGVDFVPETSPQHAYYTLQGGLGVLGEGHNAMRSSTVFKPDKNLKSLTRSVSREHGTLSQSVKRKPSLPFLSPTKVR
jgi:hypothetical protein